MLCSRFERPQINEIDASGRHCMNAGSIEPETLSSSSGDGPATSSMRVEGGKRSKPHEKVKRKVCCPFILVHAEQHTIPSHAIALVPLPAVIGNQNCQETGVHAQQMYGMLFSDDVCNR